MSTTATHTRSASDQKPTTYQRGDSVTIWYKSGLRSEEPHKILTVERCNQREVELSDGQKFKLSVNNVRPTQPGDAALIEHLKLCSETGTVEARALDREALKAIAPLMRAWRERQRRRELVILAALRRAFLSGPCDRLSLGTVLVKHGGSWDLLQTYLSKIGATLTPHNMLYSRVSTPEDHFDGIIMSAFAKKTKVTMDALLDAVITKLGGTKDEREIEVTMALGRCGAVMVWGLAMGRAAKWQLQPHDKPGS